MKNELHYRVMAEANNQNCAKPSIPSFHVHYEHWAKLMKEFLLSKDYRSLVQDGVATGREEQIYQQTIKDLEIKTCIYQAIHRKNLETIIER